jgi:quercetin dioxygenase-like cupin family protein
MDQSDHTTALTSPIPTFLDRATSERLWHLGALILVRLAAPDTDANFTLVEALAPKGYGAPLHRHSRESETLVLLDGELAVSLDDRRIDIGEPGAILHFPVGDAHGFVVRSETAHLYSIFSPAGFESFFRSLSTPAPSLELPPPPDQPPDIDLIHRIARECGCELLDESQGAE